MRIILSLLLGGALAFYLAAFLAWTEQKFNIIKSSRLHHSLVGTLILLLGISGMFLWKSWLGDPLYIFTSTFSIGAGIGIILHHLLSESFIFSEKIEKEFIHRHEYQIERLLEILPGALTWLALTSPIWLSFTLPFAVAYIILLADIYWLFNACKIAILIVVGYKKMKKAKQVNWFKKLQTDFPKEWDNYYHLLVIPAYKESLEVLTPAFDAIINSTYDKKKVFLGISFEEKSPADNIVQSKKYLDKKGRGIGGVLLTTHPHGLPGELTGPATNRNWLINYSLKEFQRLGIKPEQVLVTTLDADFVIDSQFLAGVLHRYLSTPAQIRDKRSFTGAFLYNNNYWQAPAFARLVASGTAYWQLSEMVGSDKYINFSSLSMNLKSLLDIGLWIPNKVNDDSGFYWKAYYHFNGDYKVLPHYLPISADAVLDENMWRTIENQYLQLKRWAYGVEHVPFIIRQYFSNKNLDFWDKTDKLIFIMWSYMKWGTLALFITFAGMIVPLINQNYSQSVVAYNLPVLSSWILTFAFLGLLATVFIHEKTVPIRPKNWSFFQKLWSYLQWILIPFILITIASIPAIDAQTRLMFGKYMEFRTTNKARISR
ncbi:MAG: hypothetical protein C4584_00050 [Armatimonadetes bacterium]|nr:MAG: hypothetical protein C4584_00050 [Armatimonadota bacterium]